MLCFEALGGLGGGGGGAGRSCIVLGFKWGLDMMDFREEVDRNLQAVSRAWSLQSGSGCFQKLADPFPVVLETPSRDA